MMNGIAAHVEHLSEKCDDTSHGFDQPTERTWAIHAKALTDLIVELFCGRDRAVSRSVVGTAHVDPANSLQAE